MSLKEQVSNSYTKQQQKVHLSKPYPDVRVMRVLMTGAARPRSIGQGIVQSLTHELRPQQAQIIHLPNDVRIVCEDMPSYGHALIMCHGYSWLDWLEVAPDDKIREMIDVNLYGVINMTRAFVKATIDQPYRKKIIAIGSMAYNRILNASATYCTSKAGVAQFIRCAAWELAPKGYDVYCIHPSNVDGTPMAEETIDGLARYRGISRNEAEAYWGSNYIRLRSLNSMEIGELVYFLLTPDAEFLSGQQFELTGGQR